MPLLTIVNLAAQELVLSDMKKSFPVLTVAGNSTLADVAMLGGQLEAAGPLLKKLSDAGTITYSVAEDPSVPNDLELGQAAGALENGAVTTSKLASGAVTTAKLASGAVTAAKAAVFMSGELTGTGASQSVAHGLGAAPSVVLLVPVEGHDGSGAAGDLMPSLVAGSHTSTNVVATVSNGAKFKVLAWV